MIPETTPALVQFLGSYFHEDWNVEGPDWETVVESFYLHEGPDRATAVIDDIDVLLQASLSDAALRTALRDDYLLRYAPSRDGLSDAEWLRAVQRLLRSESA